MKRNYRHVTTLEALHLERIKLKNEYEQQGEELKESARVYVRQWNPLHIIKQYFTKDGVEKIDDKFNISGKIMSLILPLLLNKTLFRGSGFITKALVGLVSNKLGRNLDLEHLTGIFDSVKGWFGKKRQKKIREVDYGIPPDSETY